MPKYSIVIPTRQRHDTLYHTLRASVAIDYDDYEIVVQDNCSGEQTRQVVDSFNSTKIVYQRSDVVLSMSDNWEKALQAARGEFVTFIGDDDALTLDSLKICDSVLELTGSDAVFWEPSSYWWPNTLFLNNRNIFYIKVFSTGLNVRVKDPQIIMKNYFSFRSGSISLPMIYNSFVSRDLIDKVIRKVGRYFACAIPDIYSGIANCAVVEKLVGVNRPLSIRGASGHSNGCAYILTYLGGEEIYQRFKKESLSNGRLNHPLLTNIYTNSISMLEANVMLCARDDLFPNDEDLVVNISSLLERMVKEMESGYCEYDQSLSAAYDIASKNGLSLEDIGIPPRPPSLNLENALRSRGPLVEGDEGVMFVIDGDLAGISNICDAVYLLDAMSSRI
jgi:glycosyltransferase involved in cell wall biosynthesis